MTESIYTDGWWSVTMRMAADSTDPFELGRLNRLALNQGRIAEFRRLRRLTARHACTLGMDKTQRGFYHSLIVLAREPRSEMYGNDGAPRRGAMHRSAFWDGYIGREPLLPHRKNSLAHAAWHAGRSYALESRERDDAV